MKAAHAQMKARGPSRIGGHAIFELKHKVVLALNKLADRDTCPLAIDELEKTAQCLTPEEIPSFLSCILDTDKDQKSAVRKECVRLMGTLVTFHECLLGPHLAKMVASIVKRLKDTDSSVRDACVETMGVLASKLNNDGVFVVLVKPLFEALGEQNKQMQSGAALCLAKVIDNTQDPPVLILQRMLTRTIKLLKNPHFMAKPAIIELNRSIIQAGGAPSQGILAAAMSSIQEALKNSDWTTRRAASTALGQIASFGGSWLETFKASCIHSLESCRFDKVKPVRDSVMYALQCWRSLPGPETPEHSETGSSVKENFCGGESCDLSSNSESIRKDIRQNVVFADSAKRRVPLSVRKPCQTYVESQHSKAEDWHIEIAVPKARNLYLTDLNNEESEGSSFTKALDGLSTDITSFQDTGCEYVPMDDKQECSASNLVDNKYQTKFVTASHDSADDGGLLKPMRRNHQFAVEAINNEEHFYPAKIRDRGSMDSTVTETSCQTLHGCCSQVASEMVFIRKQLLEIENKQANLMELLQLFSTGIVDSLSTLQSKVLGLGHEVDRISRVLMHGGRHSDSVVSKLMKENQNVSSPRLSTCTPRPSVDIQNKQPLMSSAKNTDIWEEKTFGSSRSINAVKQGSEMWTNSSVKISRNATGKDILKRQGQNISQMRRINAVFTSDSPANARQNGSESQSWLWQRVKCFLCKGDLESAYVAALCYGDELVLIELLDRTGPVLESLSQKTVSDILSTLASYILEQRYPNSIIPWLQQVVDLSMVHGPDYIGLSPKERREFLSAIQEAANMEFSNVAEKKSVTQLALKLRQLWGKGS